MTHKKFQSTVLLTGASGGIGGAIARLLAARGYRLLLQGRSADRLEALRLSLPDPDLHQLLVGDLTDSAERAAIVTRCQAMPAGVDVLINNAGVSRFVLFEDIDDGTLRDIINTNLIAI